MEFQYIEWLRARTPVDPRVLIGPGDDCALLSPPTRPLLITTDMLMDGTDFVVAEVGPRRVGRKAMAANLSDIAAMAGVPMAAVVSVALPGQRTVGGKETGDRKQETVGKEETGDRKQEAAKADKSVSSLPPVSCPLSPELSPASCLLSPDKFATELYLGLRDVADAFGVPIVGGDTNSWAGSLVISVTALGEATERGAVRRSGAKAGDWIFVTGPLGGSILGHHLDFTPRVWEAARLHLAAPLHAMIDISDGLAADVNHICEESGCGAVLLADSVPISEAARLMSDSRTPLEHALGDGEDFELAFAVAAADGDRLLRTQPVPDVTLHHVGDFVAERALTLVENNRPRPLPPTGYVHRFGS